MTAPSETPLTDELIGELSYLYFNAYHSGHHDTVEGQYADVFYSDRLTYWRDRIEEILSEGDLPALESTLTASQSEADKQKQLAAHWENLTAQYKTERDEARSECERLRSDIARHVEIASRETEARIAAEAREREAYERAAKVCEEEICACCWDDDAQAAADHLAGEIRALGERRER